MLPIAMHDIVRAETENKLREAERSHRLSWPAEHGRPQSMRKRLQSLLARS
jgi:hypothetical protein